MKRLAQSIVIVGIGSIVLSGCGGGAGSSSSTSSPEPPSVVASVARQAPVGLIAIGHLGLTGENSDPNLARFNSYLENVSDDGNHLTAHGLALLAEAMWPTVAALLGLP
jgi:lysophospholipase L1-like esterase